jgi:hypothetical protein
MVSLRFFLLCPSSDPDSDSELESRLCLSLPLKTLSSSSLEEFAFPALIMVGFAFIPPFLPLPSDLTLMKSSCIFKSVLAS